MHTSATSQQLQNCWRCAQLLAGLIAVYIAPLCVELNSYRIDTIIKISQYEQQLQCFQQHAWLSMMCVTYHAEQLCQKHFL